VAAIASGPEPLIRHATFTSVVAVIRGPVKNNAHTVAPSPTPCSSPRPSVRSPEPAHDAEADADADAEDGAEETDGGGELGGAEVQAARASPTPTTHHERARRCMVGTVRAVGTGGYGRDRE
jgi:hypothetical protein